MHFLGDSGYMSKYKFQIKTQTEMKSKQFMEGIDTENVDIEIRINDRDLPTHHGE